MHGDPRPSDWIVRHAGLVPEGGTVLDVAAGGGRHTRLLRRLGHPVVAVDIDIAGLSDLADDPEVELLQHDLEDGGPWPFADRRFAGVVVTNYLWRPILADIVASVAPGGALLYETFAAGNERFGKPSNPDFLLQPGELLDAVRGAFRIVAYEDIEQSEPKPAMVQRIVALRS
ncbi:MULTISPECIES: class I SAM-dependent methyltransferase [Oceanibaculum]|uniref:Methyltransferase family protein n=1 Tax=Oceanibaculum indicum TaxID=526216 RepID=A0A420WC10_9PROT|nr:MULTISPECIES: class I SAM-dependent methyltransferase [Oceanibaculum]MCH2393427.1 class I SAM-dependent methyltransferase [Oceanibaculum sp.]RKQ68503.1 methyltransferase family protein [Oceanibaculum indicum]